MVLETTQKQQNVANTNYDKHLSSSFIQQKIFFSFFSFSFIERIDRRSELENANIHNKREKKKTKEKQIETSTENQDSLSLLITREL